MSLETIELDDLSRRLVDALVATEMANIIKDYQGGQYDPGDDEYHKKLAKAARKILAYYTTEELYEEYLNVGDTK